MTLALLHSSNDAIEETAEAYVLGRLPAAEEQTYEEHLFICQRCQTAVNTVDEFIDVFRRTVERARVLPIANWPEKHSQQHA